MVLGSNRENELIGDKIKIGSEFGRSMSPSSEEVQQARELSGGMDADAGRLAEEIAERAEAFYKRQGWL
jgi:hypothetical protein